jgi:hypothetical protein
MSWEQLALLRDEIGLRGPIHSGEKLVDWFGARRFVVGHTHGGYAARLLAALERLRAGRRCRPGARGARRVTEPPHGRHRAETRR